MYAVVRHAGDAEDLSQEVWTRIYFSLPQYQMKGFKTWISRIAVNRAIDFKRSAARKKEEVTAELADKPDWGASGNLEHAVTHKETVELVRSKLQQLPDNYQDVLRAYYLEQQSYQDIADKQGVTLKTVESKLYRAKQWLRKHWKEEEFK
ncbi:sigma-70 family RNA polymerase sigma factor [Paenibacillus athensensis]|uniref:sigma-70 family RNA polymerase sigma factor n=1 Tax=Paenibacillus athensensis TaxID=1967502 RepID=UPI001E5BB2FF|nr:sigma-70 family RNA polymerase sigma factor [Paenibacillus athensensis]